MADLRVTQASFEVFLAPAPPTPTGSAFLQLRVSGVSYLNAVGLAPLTVSAEWVDPAVSFAGGTFAIVITGVAHEAGFVSTATTSEVTRTFQYGGGETFERRLVSAEISDASTSLSVTLFVHPRAQVWPTPFDNNVQYESQPRRRIWPT